MSILVMCHKAQVQGVSHLDPLKLVPRTAERCTRAVASSDEQVMVPRSHSSQHQCVYTARTSRLRNMFTVATPNVQNMSTQQVKLAARR